MIKVPSGCKSLTWYKWWVRRGNGRGCIRAVVKVDISSRGRRGWEQGIRIIWLVQNISSVVIHSRVARKRIDRREVASVYVAIELVLYVKLFVVAVVVQRLLLLLIVEVIVGNETTWFVSPVIIYIGRVGPPHPRDDADAAVAFLLMIVVGLIRPASTVVGLWGTGLDFTLLAVD